MSQSIKHHFVPKFYLKNFSFGEGFIYSYKKGYAISPTRYSSIKNICYVDYHNSIKEQDGSINNEVEEYFSKIESETAPLIKSLKDLNQLKKSKNKLALFIAVMLLRNPLHRDHREDIVKDIMTHLVNIEAYHDKQMYELKEYLNNGQINIQIEKFVSIPTLEQINIVANSLTEKHWGLLIPKNSQVKFITSDNPVYFYPFDLGLDLCKVYGMSPVFPNAAFLFPLKEDLCLSIIPKKEAKGDYIKILRNQGVKNCNRLAAKNAKEYIYSSMKDDALARMVYNRS